MPNTCIVQKLLKKDETVSFHQFLADTTKRQQWIQALELSEDDIADSSRVCSRHFLYGNTSVLPSVNVEMVLFS